MHPLETSIYLSALVSVSMLVILIFFFVHFIIAYQQKRNAFHRQKVMNDMELLEKERARISADFHDDLGALLSAAKLGLESIDIKDTTAMVNIRRSANYIDTVMEKVRQISNNLLPQVLNDEGLKMALEEFVDMINRTSRMKVNFSCNTKTVLPRKDQEIHLFRIAQEILNNCLKHSHADRVTILLTKKASKIHLEIKDNGCGFDEPKLRKKRRGLGIQNIMSRINILNASIYLNTAPGKGTAYTIEIPYKNEP